MEMPTPCQNCGELFELHDGSHSEKWYPGTVICKECARKEAAEIEHDEEIEELKYRVDDALYTISDAAEDESENLKEAGFVFISGDEFEQIIQQLEYCNYVTADTQHELKLNAAFVKLKDFSRCEKVAMIGKDE